MKEIRLKIMSVIMVIVMIISVAGVSFGTMSVVAAGSQSTVETKGIIPTINGWHDDVKRTDLVVSMANFNSWWSPYASLTEVPFGGGIEFNYTINAAGTVGVRQGMSATLPLNGMDIHFDRFKLYDDNAYAGNGKFAVVLAKNAGYSDPGNAANSIQGSIVLFVDTVNGQLELADYDSSSSTYAREGIELIGSDLLKYKNIKNKPFSIKLYEGASGCYSVAVTVDGETVSANDVISAERVNVLDDGNGSKNAMVAISSWYDGCFTFRFKSINCEPNNWAIPNSGNVSMSSIDANVIQVSELPCNGGLKYQWLQGIPGYRQGIKQYFPLDGLTMYMDNLSGSGSFVIALSNDYNANNPGDPNHYANALFVIVDTNSGTIKRATSPDALTDLFSTPIIKSDALAGKPFSIKFVLNAKNGLDIVIDADGQQAVGENVISAMVLASISNFNDYYGVYPCLSAWYQSTGVSVDFKSVNKEIINNASLIPAFDSYSDSLDAVNTPSWVKDLIMVELNPYTASIEGTLAPLTAILDHYAEMGVNGLWINPVSDRFAGSTNGYINKGVNTIDLALTGADNYENGWNNFKSFVDEAHNRNIRIILDVVSWGTSTDSALITEHPEFYQKNGGDFVSLNGGYAFDWDNAVSNGLKDWFVSQVVSIVDKTGIDGIRYDCEPFVAGYAVDAAIKQGVLDTCAKQIFTISEKEFETDKNSPLAYDVSQTSVDITALGYVAQDGGESLYSYYQDANRVEPYLSNDQAVYNIVDNIKNGSNIKNASQLKYYINPVSVHDFAYDTIEDERIAFGYQGIFSPFIPMWLAGDEFNNSYDSNLNYKGGVLYFNDLKMYEKYYPQNYDMFEDIKSMIALRRTYSDLFVNNTEKFSDANICKVVTSSSVQAYARYADDPDYDNNRAMLIIPNNTDSAQNIIVEAPFENAGINYNTSTCFAVKDAKTNEVIVEGTKADIAKFTVEVEGKDQRVLLIEQIDNYVEKVTEDFVVPSVSSNLIVPMSTVTNPGIWGNYIDLTDAVGGGLYFKWKLPQTKTLRNGLVEAFALDNLTLNFKNLKSDSLGGNFAIVMSDKTTGASYDCANDSFANSRIIIEIDTTNGVIRFGNNNTVIAQSDNLLYANLTEKKFAVSFTKGNGGAYNLILTVGDETETFDNVLTSSMLALSSDVKDLNNLFVVISDYVNSNGVSLEFKSIGNKKIADVPQDLTVPSDNNMAVPVYWSDWLSREELPNKTGMKFKFNNSLISVRQSLGEANYLDGLKLVFDNFNPISFEGRSDNLAFMFANTDKNADFDLYDGMLGLGINACDGQIFQYSGAAPYDGVYNYTVLLSDERIKNLVGRPFDITFRKDTDGKYKMIVRTEEFSLVAVINETLASSFDMEEETYVSITSGGAFPNRSFEIDWLGAGSVDIVTGDANGDYEVDLLDLVHIKKSLSKTTKCVNMDNSDCNIDGYVNALDVVALINLLLGA